MPIVYGVVDKAKPTPIKTHAHKICRASLRSLRRLATEPHNPRQRARHCKATIQLGVGFEVDSASTAAYWTRLGKQTEKERKTWERKLICRPPNSSSIFASAKCFFLANSQDPRRWPRVFYTCVELHWFSLHPIWIRLRRIFCVTYPSRYVRVKFLAGSTSVLLPPTLRLRRDPTSVSWLGPLAQDERCRRYQV